MKVKLLQILQTAELHIEKQREVQLRVVALLLPLVVLLYTMMIRSQRLRPWKTQSPTKKPVVFAVALS